MGKSKKVVDRYIKENEPTALKKATQILNKDTGKLNFNGIIGGKNRIYGIEILDYNTPEDYIDAWMQSHNRIYEAEKHWPEFTKSSHRIQALLNDAFLKEFTENYLAKSYFKKHKTKS
ncbi:hypothetical protein ACF07W_38575 [Streptomyces sp. NPDC015140]